MLANDVLALSQSDVTLMHLICTIQKLPWCSATVCLTSSCQSLTCLVLLTGPCQAVPSFLPGSAAQRNSEQVVR